MREKRWTPIDVHCEHCGKPLEACPADSHYGFVIGPGPLLEYRHQDGTTQCVVRCTPRPVNGWFAARLYRAKAYGEVEPR